MTKQKDLPVLWHKALMNRAADLRDLKSQPETTTRVLLKHLLDLIRLGWALKKSLAHGEPATIKCADNALAQLLAQNPPQNKPSKPTADPLTAHQVRASRNHPNNYLWWLDKKKRYQSFLEHAAAIIRRASTTNGPSLPANPTQKELLRHIASTTAPKVNGKTIPVTFWKMPVPKDKKAAFAAKVAYLINPTRPLAHYENHRNGLSQLLADLEVALQVQNANQNPSFNK